MYVEGPRVPIDRLALFAARLGARSLQAAPFFPTSMRFAKDVMTVSEQQTFLKEVNQLRSVLRMDVQLTAGFYDPRPEPTCGPLLDQALNLDYHGQLGLCTVLTGFRGQTQNDDLIADLKSETLASALPRLHAVSRQRNEERVRSLNGMGSRAQAPSLALGSPCLSCLLAFGKIQPDLVNSVVEEILMNDDLSFRVSDAIIASEFDGKEGLLLDTSTQRYHSWNETATFLWAAIEAGRTVAEMTDALCQSFEVDGATARSSVERALARLESQSLISRDAKGVV